MRGTTQLIGKSTAVLGVLLGSVILTSCNSSTSTSSSEPMPEMKAANQSAGAASAAADRTVFQNTKTAQVPRLRPQLVKKAQMALKVDSVDKSINTILLLIDKQQGDLIKLQEQQPKNDNGPHTATIQLRVQENLLEGTLNELAKLGTPLSRNITAEDVGSQIVDSQARLSNLRKTESNLQKIMDRAGSVKDVLSVAQELSDVRQAIEQIDAQLKNLQNQVAYSTITLNLEGVVSGSTPQRDRSQIQETWTKSTQSVSKFTFTLLKMGIWIIVYSPYLLILAAAGYGYRKWQRSSQRVISRPQDADYD